MTRGKRVSIRIAKLERTLVDNKWKSLIGQGMQKIN